MKKNDLFIPMQPIDWTELSSGLTADIPLATEEEHDYEDYKPLDCFASREEPALSKHPKKKELEKTSAQGRREVSGQTAGADTRPKRTGIVATARSWTS